MRLGHFGISVFVQIPKAHAGCQLIASILHHTAPLISRCSISKSRPVISGRTIPTLSFISFNCTYPSAVFAKTLYIAILFPDGSRRTLLYGQGKAEIDSRRRVVKYMIDGCSEADKEAVLDLRMGVVKQFLAQDFSSMEE